MKKEELLLWVKNDLIHKRLKLDEMGIEFSEITDDIVLFGNEGLALDSIDGLELAVGIEQKFGVKIGKMTGDIAKEKFKNPSTIACFVEELLENR